MLEGLIDYLLLSLTQTSCSGLVTRPNFRPTVPSESEAGVNSNLGTMAHSAARAS